MSAPLRSQSSNRRSEDVPHLEPMDETPGHRCQQSFYKSDLLQINNQRLVNVRWRTRLSPASGGWRWVEVFVRQNVAAVERVQEKCDDKERKSPGGAQRGLTSVFSSSS